MKYKFLNRALLYTGALFVAAVGAAIFVSGLQFSDIPITREGEGFFTLTRIAVLLAGLLTFVYGVYVLMMPRRLRRDRKRFVIQKGTGGELRISVRAIESLVQKCVDMHQEMQTSSMTVSNSREGVFIDLDISLAGNISIPLAVASLQKQIRQYLLASSGIDVREVRVSVETAERDIRESPYRVDAQEPSLPKGEIPPPPDPKPMKRGLFRRAVSPRQEAPDSASHPEPGEETAQGPPDAQSEPLPPGGEAEERRGDT